MGSVCLRPCIFQAAGFDSLKVSFKNEARPVRVTVTLKRWRRLFFLCLDSCVSGSIIRKFLRITVQNLVEPWMAILVELCISCSRSWSNLNDLAFWLFALDLAASCWLRLPCPVRLSSASELGKLAWLVPRDSSSFLKSATQRLESAIGATLVPCLALDSPSDGEPEAARENVTWDSEDLDDAEAALDVREMDDPPGAPRIGLEVVDALDDVREMDDPLEVCEEKLAAAQLHQTGRLARGENSVMAVSGRLSSLTSQCCGRLVWDNPVRCALVPGTGWPCGICQSLLWTSTFLCLRADWPEGEVGTRPAVALSWNSQLLNFSQAPSSLVDFENNTWSALPYFLKYPISTKLDLKIVTEGLFGNHLVAFVIMSDLEIKRNGRNLIAFSLAIVCTKVDHSVRKEGQFQI